MNGNNLNDAGKEASDLDNNKSQTPVGSTWSQIGNINLNLDNLLTGKGTKVEAAPSMNQLKTQSPVKQPYPPMLSTINNNPAAGNIPGFFGGNPQAQGMGSGGMRSPSNMFGNNNNNFNAFQ